MSTEETRPRGYIARPEILEPLLGRKLDPRIYQVEVVGHRCLIARDTVDEMTVGGLVKPNCVVSRESQEIGAGWIVSVGPFFGSGEVAPPPHPTGLITYHPEAALYLHAYFGLWVGKPFMAP
jgi:hypothetical protein